MQGHCRDPIPDLCAMRPDDAVELAEIFRRLVAKRPEERFATAEELVDALALRTPAGSVPVQRNRLRGDRGPTPPMCRREGDDPSGRRRLELGLASCCARPRLPPRCRRRSGRRLYAARHARRRRSVPTPASFEPCGSGRSGPGRRGSRSAGAAKVKFAIAGALFAGRDRGRGGAGIRAGPGVEFLRRARLLMVALVKFWLEGDVTLYPAATAVPASRPVAKDEVSADEIDTDDLDSAAQDSRASGSPGGEVSTSTGRRSSW